MADYDVEAQADAAAELAPIAQGGSGQVVTINRAGDGAGTRDDDTGVYTPPAPVTQEGSGIELSFSANEIDGSRILATDKKFLLSPFATDGEPMTAAVVGATFTAGAKSSRIEGVDTLAPTGLPLTITLQLRA